MESYEAYQSWRDKLLTAISNNICQPCDDPRKEKHALDFKNPLNCGCYCQRVGSILENVKNIENELKKHTEEK